MKTKTKCPKCGCPATDHALPGIHGHYPGCPIEEKLRRHIARDNARVTAVSRRYRNMTNALEGK